MTIRQMCDAYDVTPRTLRFYEAKELLFPIREGQKRLFTHKDRARLQLILRGKRFGFSLEKIRQFLDLYSTKDGAGKQLQAALSAYKERLTELKAEELELRDVMTDLGGQIDWLEGQIETMKS
jgi:DNA-binding transcriptional MerR regulator